MTKDKQFFFFLEEKKYFMWNPETAVINAS